MDPQQIKAFIDAMSASDLEEMEVSHDGWTLRLVRRARSGQVAIAPARAPEAPRKPTREKPTEDDGGPFGPFEVRAPMFGVVHLQQAPGEPPFVRVGDQVEAGRLLCTIEAMKVFNEVRTDRAGRVAAVLVTSGTEVEAGQALLRIERTGDV